MEIEIASKTGEKAAVAFLDVSSAYDIDYKRHFNRYFKKGEMSHKDMEIHRGMDDR